MQCRFAYLDRKRCYSTEMPGRMASRVSCGRDFNCVPDSNRALDTACKAGYSQQVVFLHINNTRQM